MTHDYNSEVIDYLRVISNKMERLDDIHDQLNEVRLIIERHDVEIKNLQKGQEEQKGIIAKVQNGILTFQNATTNKFFGIARELGIIVGGLSLIGTLILLIFRSFG